jgi:predicted ester cyclase
VLFTCPDEAMAIGADENKALARTALEEVWRARGSVAAEEVHAAEFVIHQHSHPTVSDLHGIDALRAFVAELQEAFPDFTDSVERQIAEGDLVMTQFTSAGTHRGELLGIAPTGRRIEWMGIELARVENGRIAENWMSRDIYVSRTGRPPEGRRASASTWRSSKGRCGAGSRRLTSTAATTRPGGCRSARRRSSAPVPPSRSGAALPACFGWRPNGPTAGTRSA